VLTPAKDGMKGAIAKAEELAATTPDSWITRSSLKNPANPEVHERTTGREILGGHRTGAWTRSWPAWERGTITGITALHPQQEGRFQGHCRGADRLAGYLRRQAGPAQDPGHRRRLHPKNLDTSLLSGARRR